MTKRDLLELISKCPDDAEFVVYGDDGRLYHEFRTSLVFRQSPIGCILIANKICKDNDKKRTFGNDQGPPGRN